MRKRNVEPGDPSSDVRTERVQRGNKTQSLWWLWLKRGLLVTLVIYILVPLLSAISSDQLKHLVYICRIRLPFFLDLSQPADLSLNHTINMYLTSEEGISLGVWHTVPENQWKESQGKDLTWYQKSLGNGSPIFIYLHGSSGTRAASHRVGVANLLSSLGYHAVVMDYRGFADSTGQTTEDGLTTDAISLYNWVKARSGSSLVVFWGHSLGSGVTTNCAVKLMEQGVVLDGVILEGAFKNAGSQHEYSWFYQQFPVLKYFLSDQKAVKKIVFPTEENLKKMRSPLLFLHSEDDHITPIQGVEQLYEMAQSLQNSERVKMVSFSGSLGYLHNGLYKDPQTPGIVKQFVLSLKDD